ncbi:cytochrome c oxidase subunit 7A2, mitochondrial [Ixodes scapularis]|uniref:Cytochrome C oxidase subunit VIIa n=1 Tax=Ixodes scapularis TaxID=6945 RepID=Q4PM38_IXOSC|nr:cytochrome c oxidase subunit 7A2, mitochondrial [Ixodes scapularis]AAY66927.1 cytochrome c oxidase subunit VIIa 2 [Ixodes scapularis]EEC06730.1 cytochrome C oxidase subunit VIIa [Ixodes scapularis]|eukprot:XP_002407861.1 cytochrome C oxidase subunit VIIa [Ixodes scapularis]
MNVARALTTLARRAPTTSVVPKRNYTPLERIKELQKQFTADDGVPVHLKGGKLDVFLYQFTMACCAVGLGWTFYNTYMMIYYPKELARK